MCGLLRVHDAGYGIIDCGIDSSGVNECDTGGCVAC